MRRVARHMFTFCSAVSLLLCVAVCVMWARGAEISRYVQPLDPKKPKQPITSVSLGRGRVGYYKMEDVSWGTTFTMRFTAYDAPLWLVASVLAVPPLLWAASLTTRRRVAAGFCPTCRYDLRATPGRCPECGTLAAQEIA